MLEEMFNYVKIFRGSLYGMTGAQTAQGVSTAVLNPWDSRYWGPMGIQFLLKPLWLFENVKGLV